MRTYIHTQLYAHISCLYRCDGEFTLEQAKLTVVPEGDWHCAKCVKKTKTVNKSTSGNTRKRAAAEIVLVTEGSPAISTTTFAVGSSTNKRARGKATAAAAVVKEEVPEEQVKPATRRSARK